MERENKIAVVTDSGSSMRPEYEKVQKLGVTVVPLEISFLENGKYVPYVDLNIPTEEFYQRMRDNPKDLPKTSGAVIGRIAEVYKKLSDKTDSIISIHITSEHSVAWASAVAGAKVAQEEASRPIAIEVIDSRQISLGTWFLAEQAALLSKEGNNLEQIKEKILAMIPQVQLLVVLEKFDNLKYGGRANDIAQAYFASILHISPIIGLRNGKLTSMPGEITISPKRSRNRMVEMVEHSGTLARLGILHTNAPKVAGEVKEALSRIYQGEISVYDAGPALGVHAGAGAIGIIFQKA